MSSFAPPPVIISFTTSLDAAGIDRRLRALDSRLARRLDRGARARSKRHDRRGARELERRDHLSRVRRMLHHERVARELERSDVRRHAHAELRGDARREITSLRARGEYGGAIAARLDPRGGRGRERLDVGVREPRMLDDDHHVGAILSELRRQCRHARRASEQRVHLAAAARIRERARRAHRLERNPPQRTAARLRKRKGVRH